jgi:membrane fusion protein (multidrug efflux system)
MSKNRKTLLIRLAVVLTALVAVYFIRRHYLWETTDDAYVQAHALILSARVGGTVQKVLVSENDKVKTGQLLAQIEDQDYAAALNQALAETAALEADSRQALLDFHRMERLLKEKAIAQQQYDSALSKSQGLAERLKGAQFKADQAKLNLSYTQITAPEEGSIAKKSVEPGMVVPQGQALFGFVSSRERWVTANFKETQLARVKLGAKAEIHVDAVPGKVFQGEVESVGSSTGSTFTLLPPDNSTGNFTKVVQRVPVKIKILGLTPEDVDRLAAGLSAVVLVRVH